MKQQQEKQQPCVHEPGAVMDDNHRKSERRHIESEGYCYIEMVGWMDRREKCRRNNDSFTD